jgi:hypothetical protein
MIFAECRGSVGRWQGACPESYYTRKNRDGLLHVQGLLKRTLHVNTGSRDGGEEPVGTVQRIAFLFVLGYRFFAQTRRAPHRSNQAP